MREEAEMRLKDTREGHKFDRGEAIVSPEIKFGLRHRKPPYEAANVM